MGLSRLTFIQTRLSERLWIRPLSYAVAATALSWGASLGDRLGIERWVPAVADATNEKLLSVISASMLGVATFAVASMLQAYNAVAQSATPRAFALVVADGRSQTALSSFIGAFIFSVVGIVATRTELYGHTGRFLTFLLTLAIFAWVVVTFVRWVDGIARLGRLGNTVARLDAATRDAFADWRPDCSLGGVSRPLETETAARVLARSDGFVQHVDMADLQSWAERQETRVRLERLPGDFAMTGDPLLSVATGAEMPEAEMRALAAAFTLGESRSFANDPRYGLVAMSEVASRALSPAVNDPGSAIDITVRLGRILTDWDAGRLGGHAGAGAAGPEHRYDRVHVPLLLGDDLMEDAFGAIARDGAGAVEVGVWLQRMLGYVARARHAGLAEAARAHAAKARARADAAFRLDEDRARLARAARDAGLVEG